MNKPRNRDNIRLHNFVYEKRDYPTKLYTKSQVQTAWAIGWAMGISCGGLGVWLLFSGVLDRVWGP